MKIRIVLITLLVLWVSITGLNAAGGKDHYKDHEGVMETLKKMHDGYVKRNVTQIGSWVNDIFTDNVRIIGTNSLYPGQFEWCSGKEAARKVFSNDWKRWGDLKIYYEQAQISVQGNHAWIAMTGVLRKTGQEAPSYARSVQRIKEITENKDMPDKLKLKNVIWDAALLLHQFEQGSQLLWPIRITATLVRKNNKWLITQTHFSYPHRGFPTIRFTEPELKKFEKNLKHNPPGKQARENH